MPGSILSHMFLFAVYTNYFYIGMQTMYIQLQTDLDNLAKWCDVWQVLATEFQCY